MKPVAIFRHVAHEGPGYLAEFLDEHAIPWQLERIDEGERVPEDITQFSGLVFMGGPMSVNDDLLWLAQEQALVRQAVGRDIPVLGHCLGAQLMSKALGGVVVKTQLKEIGWHDVAIEPNGVAHAWLGDLRSFPAFHWHGETFSLPPAAVRVLSSGYCANQAFALGKHLALQCHVEMTAEMIADWCARGAAEMAAGAATPGVQSAAAIAERIESKLPQMRAAARQLYGEWVRGLPGVAAVSDRIDAIVSEGE